MIPARKSRDAPSAVSHLHACLAVIALGALGSCAVGKPARQFGRLDPPQVYQSEHASLTVGQRSFDDELAVPVEDQIYLALNLEVEPVGSWVALDFGLNYSADDVTQTSGGLGVVDLEVDVWELSAGIHKEVQLGRLPIRPYVGVGGALMLVEASLTDAAGAALFEGDDTAFGTYARAGLLFDLYQRGQIGVDVRYLTGGLVNIGGLNVDTDYTAIGLIFRGSY